MSLLGSPFPPWFNTFPVQCLVFTVLLALATLVTALPLRWLRIVLWVNGLLYLGALAILATAALVALTHSHGIPGHVPHSSISLIPTSFSWSLFGLSVLSTLGFNCSLLLDGELRGVQRFMRGSHSTRFLRWAGSIIALILLVCTAIWTVMNLSHTVVEGRFFVLIDPILGPVAMAMAWLMLVVGVFDSALAYLLIYSRVFFLAARMGYLPRRLAQLNRAGTPLRAILIQSALIFCIAASLFVGVPALLRAALPASLVNELLIGDQFSLITSVAGALWSLFTVLMFGMALWLFWKKRRRSRSTLGQRLTLSALSFSGLLTSLVCASAPLMPDWPALFFSRTRWFPVISLGIVSSLTLAWVISELPRRSTLVRERERRLAREKELRKKLQQSYTRERDLHQHLQLSYEEVQRLYKEQKLAAMIDPITSLLNHRALMERLEEKIARCQAEAGSFLLVLLDLDHFKAINDTWGHLAGDAILRQVAERLRNSLGPEDVVGRYGGEEFVLLGAGATLAQAREEGESLLRLMHAASCSWQTEGKETINIRVTASIGIAVYGIHGTRREDFLEQADQAMYQAKLAGRDRMCVAGTRTPLAPERVPKRPRSPQEEEANRARAQESQMKVATQVTQALAMVMQARDATTSTHSSRVIRLAEETGRRLGASPEDLCLIRLGDSCTILGKLASRIASSTSLALSAKKSGRSYAGIQ